MKYIIIGLALVFCMGAMVEAPVRPAPKYLTMKVRITAYSPKEPREGHRTSTGKSAKNEKGVAVPKGFLPYGTMLILPNGEMRIVDDRIPYKSSKRFNHRVVDVRYYQSIESKSKSKAVRKEIKKYDMGYGIIQVVK